MKSRRPNIDPDGDHTSCRADAVLAERLSHILECGRRCFFFITPLLRASLGNVLCTLNPVKHLFKLPTVQSCRRSEPLECCWWPQSDPRRNLPSHQRLRIISPNEGLASGCCTLHISQTKWPPCVTPDATDL